MPNKFGGLQPYLSLEASEGWNQSFDWPFYFCIFVLLHGALLLDFWFIGGTASLDKVVLLLESGQFLLIFLHPSKDQRHSQLISYLEGAHHRGGADHLHHQQADQRHHQHCPQELLPNSRASFLKENLIVHKLFSFTEFWDLVGTCWREGVSW